MRAARVRRPRSLTRHRGRGTAAESQGKRRMTDNRIQQFQQMVQADPNNELGHFSLGKALLEAGRHEDAAASLARAVELNEKMSKAYQLLGNAYDKAGQRDRAIEVITRGVTVAHELGDRMPREAMAGLLREWGAPVPELAESAAQPSAEVSGTASTGFKCMRCGRPTGQLPKPPLKSEVGRKIHAHICDMCWREWIGMGTKVINELGLQLSTPAGQQAYEQYMLEFLQLEEV